MMFKKMMMAVCALSVSLLLCAGCGKRQESVEQGSLMSKVKAAGKIVVYTNPEFAPYEYLGANGVISGVEIDLVQKIADKLGIKAEFVSAEFDSILMSVVTGKADMGASGFTINEERKKKVDFSIPFVSSVQYVIVPENSPMKYVEDLAGKGVGCQQGTTGALMVEDAINKGILKGQGTTLKVYNSAPDGVVAMLQGKADCVVIDELVAISLANSNQGLKAIPLVKKDGQGLQAAEEFGIMLAKGNEDLMAVINQVIAEVRADGSLSKSFEMHKALTEKKADK